MPEESDSGFCILNILYLGTVKELIVTSDLAKASYAALSVKLILNSSLAFVSI